MGLKPQHGKSAERTGVAEEAPPAPKAVAHRATDRQRLELYRQIIENANDAIYTHDLDGNSTDVNPAAEKLSGYTRAEILRLNTADVLSPADLEYTRKQIKEKLSGRSELTPYVI